jgi:hypothetical protein
MRQLFRSIALAAALTGAAASTLAQTSVPTQLKEATPAANRNFGVASALSGDVLVVGVLAAGAADGSAIVYRWNGTTWVLEQTLAIPDPVTGVNSEFGRSVAISGDTIVVGAAQATVGANAAQGAAYVFVRSAGSWALQQKLTAGGGAAGAASDRFASAVAIDGDTIVSTAPNRTVAANANQGNAYVFVRSGATWSQQAVLTASDGAASDRFGFDSSIAGSLSISGDTIAVGAPAKTVGSANGGKVYLYSRQGSTWTESNTFTTPSGVVESGRFGCSVSIRGDVLAVGERTSAGGGTDRGRAWVFRRANLGSGPTWITPGVQVVPPTTDAGAALGDNDQYGNAVAIEEDTLIVGSSARATNTGRAYAFSFTSNTWSLRSTLVSPDLATGDLFGGAIALDGGTAVVSAQNDDFTGPTVTDGGSVWVFSRDNTRWLGAESRPANPNPGAINNGLSVAIDNNLAISGAYLDPIASSQGRAFVFARNGLAWSHQFTLAPADIAASDFFGYSVGISGTLAIAGSPNKTVGANTGHGRAYIFRQRTTPNANPALPPTIDWIQPAASWVLNPESAASTAGLQFGASVAISGDVAVVGAPGYRIGGLTGQGAAFVFARNANDVWEQIVRLEAADKAANDSFGISVAISGDNIIVGAYGKANTTGAAYIFTRSGSNFRQVAKLTGNDVAAGESFGIRVGIDGRVAAVGTYLKRVGSNTNQGAVYVFANNNNNTWSQVARLVASDGAPGDGLGLGVAVSGNNVLCGAYNARVAPFNAAGAMYVFTSPTGLPTGPWIGEYKITARSDGDMTNDLFGTGASISGNTVIGGGFTANTNAGVISFFDFTDADQVAAANNSSQQSGLLPDLLAAASNGQSIVATAGAFDGSSIDFAGKSVNLSSRTSITLTNAQTLSFADGSSLAAGAGYPVNLYGNVRTTNGSGRSTITGSLVRLTGTGSLIVGEHDLTFNAPVTRLEGRTLFLGTKSSITSNGLLVFGGSLNDAFGGRLTSNGGLTLDGAVNLRNSTISANGPVAISTAANMNAVSISASAIQITSGGSVIGSGTWSGAVRVSGKAIFSGPSNILGSLLIDAGASVTNAAQLSVFGAFANNGTINPAGNPAGCPNCLLTPSELWIETDLNLGQDASYYMSGTANIGGRFDNAINDPLRFDGRSGTVQMDGRPGVHHFEVMSQDYGPAGAATRLFVPGSFPLAGLTLGETPVTVNLVNQHNNANAGKEVVYVDTLVIPAGSRLNTNGYTVYTRSALIAGTVDNLNNIRSLGAPCAADLAIDGVVADSDFELFVTAYDVMECSDPSMSAASVSLPGGCPADLNADGRVDDEDFQLFSVAYAQLLCD